MRIFQCDLCENEKRRLGWWFLAFTVSGKISGWLGIVLLLIFLLIWNILPLPQEGETDEGP